MDAWQILADGSLLLYQDAAQKPLACGVGSEGIVDCKSTFCVSSRRLTVEKKRSKM